MGKKLVVIIAGLIAVAVGFAVPLLRRKVVVPPVVKPVAVTQPITPPTTRRAPATAPTYMELIRSENPAVPTTEPLAFGLELPDAAHLIVHDPVYLDPAGHLWFTRTNGEPTARALRKPSDSTEHVIQDKPVYVHWWITDAGVWAAAVIVHGNNGYDIITKTARQHLAGDRPFRWRSAFSVIGKIIVPTDVGVSVFDIEPKVVEHYHAVPGCTQAGNPPVAIPDTRGILAWAPWERGRPGSRAVSRFVDGNWTDLPTNQWPARPIQLSILLDGSVLRLAAPDPATTQATTAPVDPDDAIITKTDPHDELNALPDHISISIGQLEPPQIDEKHVTELIAQLNDADQEVRQSAFDELSRYGPGLSPMLEKVVDQQRPEGQMRIRQLLRNKLTPALGGLMPVDGRLAVARRYADGSVLFFAPAGVQIPTDHDEPDQVNPAWIVQRADGRMERPLSTFLVRDQKPDATTLLPVKDEWLVCDETGVRRFFGNDLEPLLTPAETRFSEVVGMGLHRRWVLREPKESGDTLIIDPLIADPTPKLPVWTIDVSKGAPGWDSENFPAIVRDDGGSNWELSEDSWKALPATDKVHTEVTATPPGPVAVPPTTVPATAPSTTSPTTVSTTDSLGKPILILPDGTRYFGGRDTLTVVKRNGGQIHWSLPGTAVGNADPILIQTADQLLFLYNQAGRLLRIKPTPDGPEPFVVEATFTQNIPDAEHPVRIWLDPAGRIDWISDGKTLSVMFPTGHIPKPIANMMLEVKP